MGKSISASAKGRGRPVTTGTGTTIGVRMLDDRIAVLDAWIQQQKEPDLSRPEAIRRLVELGLKFKAPARTVSKPGRRLRAHELATKTIEKIIDPAAPPEERAHRERQLLKGPEEFREARVDRPKAKGK
jgi:hypothetical protein